MSTLSDDVIYTAPFSGGTPRTLTAKLAEYVTPEDFGAVGDGTTDDTAAVQAALDSGRHLMLCSRYLVSATLDVRTAGQRLFGLGGPTITNYATIKMSATATHDTVINVRAHAVAIENLVVTGKGRTAPGSIAIFAEQDYLTTVSGENNGDVDLKITNCTLGQAFTLIKIKGRGLNVTMSNLVSFTDAVVLDWPDEQLPGADPLDPARFIEGDNIDHKLSTGMRAYMIRDNRFHAGSDGFIVRNNGWNKERIHGIQFSGNYIDTNTRIFDGCANESLFTGNIMIHSAASNYLFNITRGQDIRISDNLFYGMNDNGHGHTREILCGILLRDSQRVTIDGNHFKRLDRDVIGINEGCSNLIIRGNVMADVGRVNDEDVLPLPDQRYIVRLNASLHGLIVSENVVDNPPRLRPGSLIGLTHSGVTLSGHVIRDNLLPDDVVIQLPVPAAS